MPPEPPSETLPRTLSANLERLRQLSPRLNGKRLLLAVSGGRDSVAMLHLSLTVGWAVAVAHLDHGLRETSSEDAGFVQGLASGLGLEFASERVDVGSIAARRGWGIEEAARRVRYEFLARAAKNLGCDTILTAHTLEDNAETVLLQLLRGSGRASGIPERRGRVLRPLLNLSKRDLETYLVAQGLPWREDESNADQGFNRNWLRLTVLPLLETRFPGAGRALARYAGISRAEDSLLEAQTSAVPDWADWNLESEAIQRRLIRRRLEASQVTVDFAHLEALRLALGNAATTRVSLPGNRSGVVQAGKLHVFGGMPNGANLRWPEGFDFSAFPDARLRTRAPGDRIRLSSGTRKLSDVLIDRKLPRELRDRLTVVVAQTGEVLWTDLQPPVTDIRIGKTRDAELDAMKLALTLAREALDAREVPVGAVVMRQLQTDFAPLQLEDQPKFKLKAAVRYEIVGRGRNRSKVAGDMTRHAELEAIREATAALKTPYLNDCTLVVTLEPCLMCLGAAIEARVGRIVFAARNPKNGALGGVIDATRAAWNHHPSVRTGLLEREASALLTNFFALLR